MAIIHLISRTCVPVVMCVCVLAAPLAHIESVS